MEETFKKHFEEYFFAYKNSSIAIYGLGKNTWTILNLIENYDFKYLIANESIGEVKYGKKIVSLNTAILFVKVIIIAASPMATKIIYQRIKDEIPSDVLLYDMRGNKLVNEKAYHNNLRCNETKKNLLKKIDENEVIVFDFFDTLVMRNALDKQDIFAIIERELMEIGNYLPFSEWRIEAESKAFEEKRKPDFDDIYVRLQEDHKLSNEMIIWLKEKELGFEKSLTYPRHEMIKTFNYAKNEGKIIYLIVDSFFSEKQLNDILLKCAISGYVKCFISCGQTNNKSNRELYKQIYIAAPQKRILYIGNISDNNMKHVELSNISHFNVCKVKDMLGISSISNLIDDFKLFDDRLMLGNVLSELFNDPFVLSKNRGKIEFDDIKMMSEVCFSAITMQFLAYLIKTVKKEENAIILFVSRDGYYLHKIYQRLKTIKENRELPDAVYFYSSRKAASVAALINENDIQIICKSLLQNKKENLKSYLEKRFEIIFPNTFNLLVSEALTKYGYDELVEKILKYKETILANAAIKRKNYKIYLKRLQLEQYEKVYLVDLVTRGTVAYSLERMLERPIYLISYGTLFMPNEYVYNMENVFSLYGNIYSYSRFSPICSILELVYASKEEQLAEFDQNGNCIFINGSAYNKEVLNYLQTGIDDFLLRYEKIDTHWYLRVFSNTAVLGLLMIIDSFYSHISRDAMDKFSFYDPLHIPQKFNILNCIRGEND